MAEPQRIWIKQCDATPPIEGPRGLVSGIHILERIKRLRERCLSNFCGTTTRRRSGTTRGSLPRTEAYRKCVDRGASPIHGDQHERLMNGRVPTTDAVESSLISSSAFSNLGIRRGHVPLRIEFRMSSSRERPSKYLYVRVEAFLKESLCE